jgi:tetratricopeptide (TPR) repeat protein
MRRIVLLMSVTTLVALIAAPVVHAQAMARLSGQVVDSSGEPIEGVTISAISPELGSFSSEKTSNRKGRFTMAFPDAALPYVLTFTKEGLATLELPVQVTAGDTMRQVFTLLSTAEVAGTQPEQPAGPAPGQRVSRVVAVYNEGVEAQQLGDLATAAAKFQEAAELDNDLAAPHTALATVADLQEDWAAAASHAEEAITRDTGDVRALQIRFDAYRKLGNQEKADEAADALRAVGDLGEAAKRLFNEAVDSYNSGNLPDAQNKFQQVTELDPELVPAYTALARIALQQGAPTAAASAAAAATQRQPDNGQAWTMLFDASRMTGDEDTAATALAKVAELNPDFVAGPLFDHATTLYNEGKIEESAAELKRIVAAQPSLARARYLYGMCLYNLGRADEAKGHLEAFVEMAPDDPDVAIATEMLSYVE